MREVIRKLVPSLVSAVFLTALSTATAHTGTSGSLTLYANPNYTGNSHVTHDPSCAGNEGVTGQFASFDNAPLPGCRVALVNNSGGTYLLCAGRGVVPTAYQDSPRLRLQPGSSTPCGTAGGH